MNQIQNNLNSAAIQTNLAKLWQTRGKTERAIAGYKQALQLQPDYQPAYLELGELLLEENKFDSAIALFQQALQINPNESLFHKHLINALTNKDGLEAAFEYYQLFRLDSKEASIHFQDILACAVVRNEAIRLPYFLSYYRERGIAKFLIVDNGSTDATVQYLLEQPDVYLWQSTLSFNRANCGSAWFEVLLRKYGINHWCLIVDADEIFYYPDCEIKTLPQLCYELDEKQKKAYNAILLDMYSDKPIADTHYTPGENFLKVCPYFDRQFYHHKFEEAGLYQNQTCYFGGLRERIFGKQGEYYLSKVPLIKYNVDNILAGGQHWTNRPQREIATETGCLLHFKYFSFFLDYVKQEVTRKEHYGGAMQYADYQQKIVENQKLTFYDPQYSVKLQNSQQLVELGIMQIEKPKTLLSIEFPKIAPLPRNIQRPFWSVMITVYNRVEYLEQALRSVVSQAPSAEQMQIEVVCDGAENSVSRKIEAIVNAVGDERVNFYCHPENIGHPHIFNLCLERAQGYWIHILHDDDWVKPGFYQALQHGIEQEAHLGAAFCRHFYADQAGQRGDTSMLESETPGVINNWLEKIAQACRLQFPSIVVKREVYEKLGGFCPEANSAFDWEMWKRIAVYYPVWYEPQPLACFRGHPGSESYGLIQSGQQIADIRKAIEISQSYLPDAVADELSNKACKNLALYALAQAKQQFKKGKERAAIANIQQGLQCSQAEAVKATLNSLIQQYPQLKQTL